MSVEYRMDGDVAVITLNRPSRLNSIEPGLAEGIVEALGRAGGQARAAVLTGAGKAFCSGADLSHLLGDYETGGPSLAAFLDEAFHPVVDALVNCEAPTVAAVNGVAAGAGLGLSLACDIRVMAESAFLASAFTAIGLAPDSGTTWWLPRAVGLPKAIELTMTNKRVGAEEARALGLCAEVAPDGQVVPRAIALAASLADLVPHSLTTTRRLIREAADLTLDEALAAERAEQERLGKTREHREGVYAFLEKREADFRGAGDEPTGGPGRR